MRLKFDFLIGEVAGRIIAIPASEQKDEFNGYITLNKTGKIIFELLKDDVTYEQIFDALKEQFPDAQPQEMRDNMSEFLHKLESENLLV